MPLVPDSFRHAKNHCRRKAKLFTLFAKMKPSKVIRNPYTTACKPEDSGKKRTQRPWEGNEAKVPSAPPAAGPAPIQPPVAQQQSQSVDDSFDCGIDWDAALQTLEKQAVFDAVKAPPPPPSSSNAQPIIPKPAPPAKEKESRASNAASSNNTALSELRPSSWKVHPPQPTARKLVSADESTVDPDQQTLPQPLRFQPKDVAPVRDEHQKNLVKHADVGGPLLNGWTLYNHQKKAILKGLSMRRSIVALDMGLGKSLVGAIWAKAFVRTMQCHVVVLCPVSLQEEWKRNMEQAVGLTVKDLNGASKKNTASSSASETPSVSIHSWSKIPSEIEETYGKFVVVADEAHSIQSMQAARTKDTLKLVSSKLCEGVLLLTGTPMKNGKPANLFPLLKAVKHPLGRNQKAYEACFCGGREVDFGRGRVWQATGAANLEILRRLTKSHMLHLTKEACLKDLPPLSRVFVKVPVSSRRQLQHNHALQDLAKLYNSQRSGPDEKILGAVQKVRMVGSLAKVEAAVQQAKKILLEEPAVVIFTSFQEVARQVHQQLAEAGWQGEILTGETPAKKRQGMVDNFQKGLSPVFCCTFGAGGVGLTLTAAHSIILLDRPWTPGDAHQAEDRVRRIGQTRPVKSIWLRAFDLDMQIDSILEQKKQTTAAVLTNTNAASSESSQSAPRLSIFQMLKSVLPEKSDGLTQTSILQFSQEVL